MSELAKAYLPQEVEKAWYQRWLDAGCFHGDEHSPKPKYSIVIPPPNVTGMLTMGHVLNNTIQDILARRARMTGHEVLWLPGTDHAGIATQNVVEKSLRKEGAIKHRDDLGREALVAKIWEWKEQYGGIILKQLRALGCSCDWDRTRFTLDEDYSRAVQRVFVDLYKKGLIYRGKRMVNWCPVALSAISDEEVIMKPQHGFMYHFRVEVVEEPGTFLTIATTRPETIPADTAVAVNPQDPRYQHLVGKHVYRALPLDQPKEQRRIPIIADEHVDFEFGTGVLKVTPAHDKADYEIGLRHGLPVIDVLTPDAKLTADAGADLAGLDRFVARKKAAEILEAAGALEKAEPYQNNVGFSERADVPIEPWLSEQWFLKYPSVDKAHACVAGASPDGADATGRVGVPPADPGILPGSSTGETVPPGETPGGAGGTPTLPDPRATMRFFPERWAKVYDHWMTGIQDWCISRQLWWGHRIPVWSKTCPLGLGSAYVDVSDLLSLPDDLRFIDKDSPEVGIMIDGKNLPSDAKWLMEESLRQFEQHKGENPEIKMSVCTTDQRLIERMESQGWEQDSDVLDTWFSSWLWPFATMGWTGDAEQDAQNATLKAFYPTTDLVTGPDIIFFWVARMIMAGYEWMGEMPFKNVYFTGIIRDKKGLKMSKSLGNSPDPLDLIAKYGADGVRFGLMRIAPQGQDIKFDETQVEEGRNFANKLWNACRYRQMQGGGVSGFTFQVSGAELTPYAIDILAKLDALQKNLEAAYAAYEFNTAAGLLYEFFWSNYCDLYLETIKGDTSPATLATQDAVLKRFLPLLHPFMPHITEELWALMGYGEAGTFLMQTQMPQGAVLAGVPEAQIAAEQAKAAAIYAAAARARNLKSEYGLASNRGVRFVLKPAVPWAAAQAETLRLLAGAGEVALDPAATGGPGIAAALTDVGELYLPLEGLIDVAAERARLQKELAKAEAEIAKAAGKLNNPAFKEKAPEAYAKAEEVRADWQQKQERLQAMLKNLG